MDIRLEKRLYDFDSLTVDSSLDSEYKTGFILCPTIYGSLEKYEGSTMAFNEYLPLIMKSVDPKMEAERWNDFWSKR